MPFFPFPEDPMIFPVGVAEKYVFYSLPWYRWKNPAMRKFSINSFLIFIDFLLFFSYLCQYLSKFNNHAKMLDILY